MVDDPKLIVGIVAQLEAASLGSMPTLIPPNAVTVNPLGVPELDGRVCVQREPSEHRILRVSEHSRPFDAENSSSESFIAVLIDLSHELELTAGPVIDETVHDDRASRRVFVQNLLTIPGSHLVDHFRNVQDAGQHPRGPPGRHRATLLERVATASHGRHDTDRARVVQNADSAAKRYVLVLPPVQGLECRSNGYRLRPSKYGHDLDF